MTKKNANSRLLADGSMSALSNWQTAAADDIGGLVAAADKALALSVEKSLEAGRRLLLAKEECPHGTWLPFLARAGVAERKAQRLMTLARSGLKSDTVSALGGVTGALEFLRKRDTAAELLAAAELTMWPDILVRAETLRSEGADSAQLAQLFDGLPAQELDRDIERLMTAMQLMQDAADMFSTKAAA